MNTPTKEELQERAYLIRAHEANCKIEHPTDEERAFRMAVMKKLGVAFGLREMRGVTIATPGATKR
jgi:hypothetical protein